MNKPEELNEQDAREFFNKVQNKKIRYSAWNINEYFIPRTLYNLGYGWRMDGEGFFDNKYAPIVAMYVGLGFDIDEDGYYWLWSNYETASNDLDEESITDTTMPTLDQEENKILSEKVNNLQQENDQLRQRLNQLESLVRYESNSGKLNIY